MKLYIKILLFTIVVFINHSVLIAQSRVQELTSTQYKKSIFLNFIITSGSTCSGYQIQHSLDSINFELLFDYYGICGEQTKSQSFSFIDENPVKNAKNYYRVFIPPNDYSKINAITYFDLSDNGYLLFNNPVNDNLTIMSSNTNSLLKIFNQTGSLVKAIYPNENGLYNEDVSSLESGLYLFFIESNQGKNITGKFLKL